MVRVVKHSSNGTVDFEFVGFEFLGDFDVLASILISKMNSNVIEKIDGIYSRYWTFEKDNIKFKLMYHEDTGNCLCPISASEENFNFLNELAHKILTFINN